jgi:hypothetical protein
MTLNTKQVHKALPAIAGAIKHWGYSMKLLSF